MHSSRRPRGLVGDGGGGEPLLPTLTSHRVKAPRDALCTGPELQLPAAVQAPGPLEPPHVPMGQSPFSFYFAPNSGKAGEWPGWSPDPSSLPLPAPQAQEEDHYPSHFKKQSELAEELKQHQLDLRTTAVGK